jgi:hypothetical protein
MSHIAHALFGLLLAFGPAAATPPPTAAPTAPSAQPFAPIPPAILSTMYARELGRAVDASEFPKLLAAHELIERFFTESSAEAQRRLARQIAESGIDAATLGRLCRIRLGWAELKPGVYSLNERVGPYAVRYFLGIPKEYDRTRPWPLVIKLPTAHAFVTNPPPAGDEVARIYATWIADDLAKHPDAVVIMPLLNLDELYGPSQAGMDTLIQPMLHACGLANIDVSRVCLIGHSMAAHAVWNLGLHYPTYFASINPMAGAASADWQRLRLPNLRNVLPVVWHDADDTVLKPAASRDIVNALRRLKIDVRYTETKNLGHAPPEIITEQLYAEARQRRRELYPKRITMQSNRTESRFNRIDWLQVYQPLRPGEERRLLFRHGSGHMTVFQNAYKIDASIPRPNRIEITCDNVALLRLYLNDQMADLARPVTVFVNGKNRFEGAAHPSVEEMLNDQLFLGRGWRYFTGVIDIDLDTMPVVRKENAAITRPATRGR